MIFFLFFLNYFFLKFFFCSVCLLLLFGFTIFIIHTYMYLNMSNTYIYTYLNLCSLRLNTYLHILIHLHMYCVYTFITLNLLTFLKFINILFYASIVSCIEHFIFSQLFLAFANTFNKYLCFLIN